MIPLCRLHFNTANKYLELFHNGKDLGERVVINGIDDLYGYKEELQKAVEIYE